MSLRVALNAVLATMLLSGCSSAGQRLDQRARAAGLEIVHVSAGAFPSIVYLKRSTAADHASEPLTVFLESDGIPWLGRAPSDDPTPRRPVALEMLMQAPSPAAYVTRPCYNGLRSNKCNFELWTGARYSTEVVDSMVATVRDTQRRIGAERVALVGYSGGGALAVLIAERLENVASVVTVAANLDTDAWADHHEYLQLSQSLNPALSDRPHPWPELHLRGANDQVVPPATTARYFERYPQARQRTVEGFDHVCCWLRDWPTISAQPTPPAP
ncbi:alpha/beta fold hydrolase [Steroidobacter cummioxidans]|uniref:alpha/beta fold hydrolase n=1 Tax=Steroidobacter cummioxidans TaxID=1803913 RepID=UPI000E31AAED|nr:alpha/beta hydrolase [Steroidobacter cummioxidans]